jgi:hypothetical protein
MHKIDYDDELGFRERGTSENILVIIFAWTAQLCEVSFLAVTSTEYLWAVAILSTSIGDF